MTRSASRGVQAASRGQSGLCVRAVRCLRWVATLTLCLAGIAVPGAAAVSITQHPLPGALTDPEVIGNGSAGLLVSGVSSSLAFAQVNPQGGPALIPGPAGPDVQHSLTVGANGDLWYLSATLIGQEPRAAIFEVTPGGVVMRAAYPSTGDAPVSMVAGPDGALWIVDVGSGGAIDRYVPGGPIVQYAAPRGPVDIVAGPDGALWFTQGWPSIGRITTTGEITEYPLPAGVGPYGITVAPDGALWFAEWEAGAIGRMTTRGELRQFAVPNPTGLPAGAGGPTPTHLTVGPEGAIWFTDPGDDSVGRLADGQVTEYPIPLLPTSEQVQPGRTDANPDAIAAGPGGALWVTEGNAKAIASVDPNGMPTKVATTRATSNGRRLAKGRARCLRYHRQSSALGAKSHSDRAAACRAGRAHRRSAP
jgi:virginiamycin B lyase